ncbi:hypothetical protein ACLOJK_024193 [Asimina triloba]
MTKRTLYEVVLGAVVRYVRMMGWDWVKVVRGGKGGSSSSSSMMKVMKVDLEWVGEVEDLGVEVVDLGVEVMDLVAVDVKVG